MLSSSLSTAQQATATLMTNPESSTFNPEILVAPNLLLETSFRWQEDRGALLVPRCVNPNRGCWDDVDKACLSKSRWLHQLLFAHWASLGTPRGQRMLDAVERGLKLVSERETERHSSV